MRIKFRRSWKGSAGSFSSGEIADLHKDIAIDLCNANLAFPVKEKQVENQMTSFPKHRGGGWYELSNGKKVRGKEKAMKEEDNI